MNQIAVTVGNNLRRLRAEKQLSQKEIADFIHIDNSVYSRIESGEIMASEDKLIRLAAFYKVDMNKIYEGAFAQNPNNYDSVIVHSQIMNNNITNNCPTEFTDLIKDLQ